MTLFDLIQPPKFQGEPRFVRGTCSAKDRDSEGRDENEIQSRIDAWMKRRIENRAKREYSSANRFDLRKARHDRIVQYLSTVTEDMAHRSDAIGVRLGIPATTVTHDMKRLREAGAVKWKSARVNGRVYWLGRGA